MDRRTHEEWEMAGCKIINDRARERVEEILNDAQSEILSAEVQKKIRDVVQRAEASIKS